MMTASFEAAHYKVSACADLAVVHGDVRRLKPDVVVLDLDADVDRGLRAIRRVTSARMSPDVIALLAYDDNDLRLAALQAGATDVVCKPFSDNVMQARIRSLLRASDALNELRPDDTALRDHAFAEPTVPFGHRSRIVVLSSRPTALMPALAGLVTKCPSEYEVHHSTADFAGAQDEPPPDLFIIDGIGPMGQPKSAGEVLRLQADLRSRSALRHANQLVILPPDAADLAAMTLDMGADDLVSSRVTRDELSHRIDRLLRHKARSDGLRANIKSGLAAAVKDPLTGLYNRRFALPHMTGLAEAGHDSAPFCVMILDIDHFKQINDRFGHATGDQILIDVASRLQAQMRPTDILARIGGEEFLVVMAQTALPAAQAMAERLRQSIFAEPFDGGADQRDGSTVADAFIRVTLSVGVAQSGPDTGKEGGVSDLMSRADAALYRAKAAGRNKVILSPEAA